MATKFYSCVDESVGEELSDVAAVVAGQCFVHEMCDGTTLIGKSTNTFDGFNAMHINSDDTNLGSNLIH